MELSSLSGRSPQLSVRADSIFVTTAVLLRPRPFLAATATGHASGRPHGSRRAKPVTVLKNRLSAGPEISPVGML